MQVPGARDVAVEFFTLSKSYNMAGWRIGFMVGNKTLVNALARIKSYHDYGTFTPLQVAAIAALEGDQQCVRDIAEQYKRRRDVLVKGLHEAGWMVECPKASMYVWAKIPEPYAAMGSLEFAKKLLNEAKVCVSPGIGFGDYGDTHVRLRPDREPGPYAPGDPRYQGDVPRGWSAGLRELALRAARQNKNGSMKAPVFLTPLQSRSSGQKYRPKR
ncbi:PLP-dependent aminotransferase YfdZ [Klebsiella pneumoniae]|uniref:PLP-dependent aminotransferase YfdZ n=1 Tax=Klebsiella pneumoniae TaxID=573 RepID=A0A377TZB9_KLEPN|nr:PLP-dependent aminotransferase YfdZ [Klebsiella pneumoniae]